jgi:hypothetical protein
MNSWILTKLLCKKNVVLLDSSGFDGVKLIYSFGTVSHRFHRQKYVVRPENPIIGATLYAILNGQFPFEACAAASCHRVGLNNSPSELPTKHPHAPQTPIRPRAINQLRSLQSTYSHLTTTAPAAATTTTTPTTA